MTTPPPPPYYVRHAVYHLDTGAYIDSEAGSVSGDEADDVPRRSSRATSDLENQTAVRPPPRCWLRWCPCWFDVRWIHALVSLLATAAILAVLIGPALYRHEHKQESWLE